MPMPHIFGFGCDDSNSICKASGKIAKVIEFKLVLLFACSKLVSFYIYMCVCIAYLVVVVVGVILCFPLECVSKIGW